ncbi:MAG: hypothetical protein KDE26_10470 [Bacteroidetes bacterium]|nr:hypothetical protein [Bacteroidota bacterium]MCB0843666.1 hypothetical protein [Bacteroidota bacterium]
MIYLNNPRGRGQQTGYYLSISRINQVRVMVLFLFTILLISSFTSQAHSLKTTNHTAQSSDFSANSLFQDLSKVRTLIQRADKLRAFNHKMTAGPAPKLSKAASDQIRENYRIVKELEKEAEMERKRLTSNYPILQSSGISTGDLAYLGSEDLGLALSVSMPADWNQLIVLLGISIVSLGMVGVCLKSMS